MSRLFSWLTTLTLPVYFNPPDAGAGAGGSGSSGGSGGSAGGTGAGAGAGGGAGAAGASAGSGQGGQALGSTGQSTAPSDWREDAQYRTPDGRVVTGRQLIDEQRQSLEGDYRGRYQKAYDLLLAEAKRLDTLHRGQGQQSQQQTDPLAEIEQLGVIDGKTLAGLYRQLQSAGLGPIARVVGQMQQQLQAATQKLSTYDQRFGSQDEDAERAKFDGRLDDILSKIEVKGINGKIDPKNQAIRDLASNLYLSYVPSSWRAGEFEKMLGDLLSSVVDTVRTMDRTHAEDARQSLRRNFNPNRGGASPTGQKGYEYQTPRALARMAADAGMFRSSNTT